nr:MAG TPA: hypothetical protein [Caudoviricetes sp.]
MQPANDAVCNLFIPLLICASLIAVVVLQFALGNKTDF